MTGALLIAFMVVGTGIAFSGTVTYFYQWLSKEEARLRYDGDHIFATTGHLLMSFCSGPFIMLGLGWRRDSTGGMHLSQAFLSAFIAFGWSFILGLLVLWFYLGVSGAL